MNDSIFGGIDGALHLSYVRRADHLATAITCTDRQ
jgi:hypothetical protein